MKKFSLSLLVLFISLSSIFASSNFILHYPEPRVGEATEEEWAKIVRSTTTTLIEEPEEIEKQDSQIETLSVVEETTEEVVEVIEENEEVEEAEPSYLTTLVEPKEDIDTDIVRVDEKIGIDLEKTISASSFIKDTEVPENNNNDKIIYRDEDNETVIIPTSGEVDLSSIKNESEGEKVYFLKDSDVEKISIPEATEERVDSQATTIYSPTINIITAPIDEEKTEITPEDILELGKKYDSNRVGSVKTVQKELWIKNFFSKLKPTTLLIVLAVIGVLILGILLKHNTPKSKEEKQNEGEKEKVVEINPVQTAKVVLGEESEAEIFEKKEENEKNIVKSKADEEQEKKEVNDNLEEDDDDDYGLGDNMYYPSEDKKGFNLETDEGKGEFANTVSLKVLGNFDKIKEQGEDEYIEREVEKQMKETA